MLQATTRPPAASRGRTDGFTLLELTVAMVLLALGMMIMVQQVSLGYRTVQHEQHRSFAFQKAAAIIAEIQSSIDRNTIQDTRGLEDLADGPQANPVLTTLLDPDGQPFPADHEMSGNSRGADRQWVWGRRIVVEPHEEQASLRYVKVHVGRRPQGGGTWREMAHAAAVLALPAASQPSRQVVDVFLVAIGNALSDLGPIDEVRAAVTRQVADLESVDQGVNFRLHWITRLGYGRDALYTPWCDQDAAAGEAVPFALYYPGRTSDGRRLYAPDLLGGRAHSPTGTVGGYDPVHNPHPVAIPDRWNHCMPQHLAERLRSARITAGHESEDAPPLDALLGMLHDEPDRFRNALILNLHGSGLPMPPLRPVADPARDGIEFPGVRAVTHAATVFTPRVAAVVDGVGPVPPRDAEFRVHAWATVPQSGPSVMEQPITLRIPGPNLSQRINDAGDPTLQIRRLPGGIDPVDGTTTGAVESYAGFDEPAGAAPRDAGAEPREMFFTAGYSVTPFPHTWVKLFNTPLVAPPVDGRGLDPAQRLYGVDHIPSPVAGDADFPLDLATAGTGPKNTARWRVRIPKAVLSNGTWPGGDQRVEVMTSIGDDPDAGTAWPAPHQPHNLSQTATWWCDSPADVPVLMRTHLVGDPRLVPQADLLAGGAFAHSYNWYFDDLSAEEGSVDLDWPGLDGNRMQDGFGAGFGADVARYGKLLRQGLQRSGAVWIDVGGTMGHRLLPGGGIADVLRQWQGASAAIAAHGPAFGASGSVLRDTMRPPQNGNEQGGHQVLRSGDGQHFGLPWFDGLAPDAAAADWALEGNLAAGAGPTGFHAAPLLEIPAAMRPAGSDMSAASGGFLGAMGSAALLNNGGPTATFLHSDRPGTTAYAGSPWIEVLESLGEDLPGDLPSSTPFRLQAPWPGQMPWQDFPDTHAIAPVELIEAWWHHTSGELSAGLIATAGGAGQGVGFIAPIALTPEGTDSQGTPPEEQLVRAGLLGALRASHRLGRPGTPGRIPHDPMVVVQDPQPEQLFADPVQLRLRWSALWRRFDGRPYTYDHPMEFAETEADYSYAIKVSGDEGATWWHAVDGQPATPGQRPSAPQHEVADAVPGSESLIIPTPPGRWPAGKFRIRVESFHRNRRLHYAWHEVHVQVRR